MLKFVPIMFKGYVVLISSDFVRTDDHYIMGSDIVAKELAAQYDAVLPTPELVEEVNRQATCRPESLMLDPADDFSFIKSSKHTMSSINSCPDKTLIAGHKKTVVQSIRDDRTAIYGWTVNGRRIQPYSTVHDREYRDYSQGVRLVAKYAISDTGLVPVEELLSCKTDRCVR